MPNDYIPAADPAFNNWFGNFDAVVGSNPAEYGLTTEDGTNINSAFSDWQTKYAAATDPGTRTPAAVQAKDAARASSESLIRALVRLIQADPSVTDNQRVAAGLTVRKTTPTPTSPPDTFPVLSLVGQEPGVAIFDYYDSATPTSKAKPKEAIALHLLLLDKTAEAAGNDPHLGDTYFTKSPVRLALPAGTQGHELQIKPRWQGKAAPTGAPQWGPDGSPVTIFAT